MSVNMQLPQNILAIHNVLLHLYNIYWALCIIIKLFTLHMYGPFVLLSLLFFLFECMPAAVSTVIYRSLAIF